MFWGHLGEWRMVLLWVVALCWFSLTLNWNGPAHSPHPLPQCPSVPVLLSLLETVISSAECFHSTFQKNLSSRLAETSCSLYGFVGPTFGWCVSFDWLCISVCVSVVASVCQGWTRMVFCPKPFKPFWKEVCAFYLFLPTQEGPVMPWCTTVYPSHLLYGPST